MSSLRHPNEEIRYDQTEEGKEKNIRREDCLSVSEVWAPDSIADWGKGL